jgi:type VI secretion system secreted protein VgrG
VNGQLLVVRSRTAARELGSTHTMECTDAARPYRPARRPKPRIAGTQVAFVVGAGKEEIDVDALGRVEVELRWDRRSLGSRTSRRVRVSQGWAGPGYGFVCLPRVGDEVLIEYLDGDPDQPLVVGRVHNAVSVSPLSLPEEKTVSVWQTRSSPGGDGYNQIRMDDAAGAELMSLRAQRDFRQEVLRNADVRVGVGQTTSVGGSAAASVGGDQSLKVGGTYAVSAGTAITFTTDAFSASAASSIHLTTPGERLDESGNHIAKANAIYLQAGEVCQVTGPAFHVFCDHIVLQAGGSRIVLTPGGITIESAGVVDVKGSLIKLNSP